MGWVRRVCGQQGAAGLKWARGLQLQGRCMSPSTGCRAASLLGLTRGRLSALSLNVAQVWPGLRPGAKMRPDESGPRARLRPGPWTRPQSRPRPLPPRPSRSREWPAALPRRAGPARLFCPEESPAQPCRRQPPRDAALHVHRHPAFGQRLQGARDAQPEGESLGCAEPPAISVPTPGPDAAPWAQLSSTGLSFYSGSPTSWKAGTWELSGIARDFLFFPFPQWSQVYRCTGWKKKKKHTREVFPQCSYLKT